ncbi:MAG: TetR/AcrR family transcriptional regulator [Paracoccaceae bacterium]|jgi:AcrR family transcriptional regulator
MTKVTQEQLVSLARDMFRDRGYAGASIGDIAAALGLRKASLYSRIESKAHLARAAIALTRAELALPEGLPEDWRQAYAGAMRYLADRLAEARRCIGLHLLYDATVEPEVRAELELFFAELEQSLVQLAVDALGQAHAERLAQEALCLLEGGTLWLLLREDRGPLDRMVAEFCEKLPVEDPEPEPRKILARYGVAAADASSLLADMAAEIADLEGEVIRLRAALEGQIEAESCFR